MGRGGGSRAAGAIAHMEMGEVFKTAGFRRARGRARGSCGDADRDDARRAVEGVADGLVSQSDKEHAVLAAMAARSRPNFIVTTDSRHRRAAWRRCRRASRLLKRGAFRTHLPRAETRPGAAAPCR